MGMLSAVPGVPVSCGSVKLEWLESSLRFKFCSHSVALRMLLYLFRFEPRIRTTRSLYRARPWCHSCYFLVYILPWTWCGQRQDTNSLNLNVWQKRYREVTARMVLRLLDMNTAIWTYLGPRYKRRSEAPMVKPTARDRSSDFIRYHSAQ